MTNPSARELLSTVQATVKNPPVWAEPSRALCAGDMLMLSAAPLGSKAPGIKAIRSSHHQLARLMATGMKNVEVSACTGFSQSRISILKSDPTFAELLLHYEATEDSRHAEIQDTLKHISLDAMAIVRERLHEDPEAMPTSTLLKITEMGLDRSGHGPQSNVAVAHAIITPEDADAIKASSNRSKIYSKAERLQDGGEHKGSSTVESGAGLETKEVKGITLKGPGV